MQSRTKLIVNGAMFTCLALIFSYVEAILPLSVGIPGVKLGLANLVIIIALYKMNFKYAFAINTLRIVIAGLLFSGIFGLFYSLAGGIVSIFVMLILKSTDKFSMIGVSMAGGVAHNFGQVICAAFLVSNIRMFAYFPILMFSGIISGILIGFVASLIEGRLPNSMFK